MAIIVDGITCLEDDETWDGAFNPLPQADGEDIVIATRIASLFISTETASGNLPNIRYWTTAWDAPRKERDND